ncbi:hypothetical protein CDAR_496411 [Caerostris darwini]|uniref:Uncharacterized protein n=1 Tax=Caerostris darwini TaxID=1538125 RepID=A0AAV4NWJ1_9ARAC|nr:hypothetical protein CDAR_496411 [Caerostris darwini]
MRGHAKNRLQIPKAGDRGGTLGAIRLRERKPKCTDLFPLNAFPLETRIKINNNGITTEMGSTERFLKAARMLEMRGHTKNRLQNPKAGGREGTFGGVDGGG